MKNVRIDELKNDLCIGDLGEYFCDYSDGYIGDIIMKIADNNIAIYYNDIFEWAKSNIGYIEEALNEFGTPQDSNGNADFIRIIQQGQYYANEKELYENLKGIILFRIYDHLQHDLDIAEITEEQQAEIEALNIEDNHERLENLLQQAEDIVKNEEIVSCDGVSRRMGVCAGCGADGGGEARHDRGAYGCRGAAHGLSPEDSRHTARKIRIPARDGRIALRGEKRAPVCERSPGTAVGIQARGGPVRRIADKDEGRMGEAESRGHTAPHRGTAENAVLHRRAQKPVGTVFRKPQLHCQTGGRHARRGLSGWV